MAIYNSVFISRCFHYSNKNADYHSSMATVISQTADKSDSNQLPQRTNTQDTVWTNTNNDYTRQASVTTWARLAHYNNYIRFKNP